jgi:hypothetical protein
MAVTDNHYYKAIQKVISTQLEPNGTTSHELVVDVCTREHAIGKGQKILAYDMSWQWIVISYESVVENTDDGDDFGWNKVIGYKYSIAKDETYTTEVGNHEKPDLVKEFLVKRCHGLLKVKGTKGPGNSNVVRISDGNINEVVDVYVKRIINDKKTKNEKDNPMGHEIYDEVVYLKLAKEGYYSYSTTNEISSEFFLKNFAICNDKYTTGESLMKLVHSEMDGDDITGLIPVADQETTDSTELMGTASQEFLESIVTEAFKKSNEANLIKAAVNNKIEQIKAVHSMMLSDLNETLSVFQKKIKAIMKVIAVLEIYAGISTNVVQIGEGEDADPDDKLFIRQMTLYMDEEIGNPEDGGFDFYQMSDFDEWVVKDDNYLKLVPESKCIVLLRPRRYDKMYVRDPWANSIMNVNNKIPYLLIRNGTNIYRICDENMDFGPRLFPLSEDLTELYEKYEKAAWDRDREEAEDAIHAYSKNFMVIQSLINRTSIYRLPPDVSLFNPESYGGVIELVADEENVISDGRPDYKQWLRDLNKSIEVGDRIYFDASGVETYKKEYQHRLLAYYSNDYNVPPPPSSGLYHVVESKSVNTQLFKDNETGIAYGIRYNPEDTVYDRDYSSHRRKVPLTFMIYREDHNLINYENINVDELEYYINDRHSRKYYATNMWLLKGILADKKEELKVEDDFIQFMISNLSSELDLTTEQIKYCSDLIYETVGWWKTKVKRKRPINSDDKKAMEMITIRVKSKLKKKFRLKIATGVDNTKKVLLFTFKDVRFFGHGFTKKAFVDTIDNQLWRVTKAQVKREMKVSTNKDEISYAKEHTGNLCWKEGTSEKMDNKKISL